MYSHVLFMNGLLACLLAVRRLLHYLYSYDVSSSLSFFSLQLFIKCVIYDLVHTNHATFRTETKHNRFQHSFQLSVSRFVQREILNVKENERRKNKTETTLA